MRSPWTANDDQPGPIGWRHISTGFVCAQSVSIRTPWMMLLRSGPRKPGHSAGGPFDSTRRSATAGVFASVGVLAAEGELSAGRDANGALGARSAAGAGAVVGAVVAAGSFDCSGDGSVGTA